MAHVEVESEVLVLVLCTFVYTTSATRTSSTRDTRAQGQRPDESGEAAQSVSEVYRIT